MRADRMYRRRDVEGSEHCRCRLLHACVRACSCCIPIRTFLGRLESRPCSLLEPSVRATEPFPHGKPKRYTPDTWHWEVLRICRTACTSRYGSSIYAAMATSSLLSPFRWRWSDHTASVSRPTSHVEVGKTWLRGQAQASREFREGSTPLPRLGPSRCVIGPYEST